jgi:hypothetical protein
MSDKVNVETLPCVVCHQTSVITVNADAFRRWQSGVLVQNAFPDMPLMERELLLTGTHPKCWGKMFADPEE